MPETPGIDFKELTQEITARVLSYNPEDMAAGAIESDNPEETELKTQVSKGYSLSIPELGTLFISHDGDVIFDALDQTCDRLLISAPSQVILNGSTASSIEVEATAAILTGKATASPKSLIFHGTGFNQPTNGLFIESGSSLNVEHLELENALLINNGILNVERELDLNGGCFF